MKLYLTKQRFCSINDEENDDVRRHAPQPKRRVTFSNEVSACPPPGWFYFLFTYIS